MPDQIDGMVRDSDVKFECRLLLMAVLQFALPKYQEDIVLEIISKITKLENERLEALRDA